MGFLRSVWYLAAWQDELKDCATLGRTYLGEPVVLFRDSKGVLQAIGDRCPHRFAPLHLGKVKGDVLECPYHGLQFDGSGACVHSPHADGKIPQAAKVKSYPVLERHHGIWIWMGDPAKADPAKVPNCARLDEFPQETFIWSHMPTNCNYQLLTDNILDLTHADYLHASTLGVGMNTKCPAKVWEDGDNILSHWWMPDAPTIPALAFSLPDPQANADTWNEIRWSAPATMELRVGATPTGQSREKGVDSFAYHIMTPETETTTHYFFGAVRNFSCTEEGNEILRQILRTAFLGEDKPMVEAQQAMMGTPDLWSLKPVLLATDAGAVRVRRKVEAMIAQE